MSTLRSDAAEIVFDHVTKRYGGSDRPAVDDLSLTIPAGEICVLIGPSGGGKTTAMKLVNRLITLTDGDITIDGTSVMKMDPVELRRGIGYVIQQIGLFPHMTIEANVATVPKLVGWDKGRTRERCRELLELVVATRALRLAQRTPKGAGTRELHTRATEQLPMDLTDRPLAPDLRVARALVFAEP